VRYLTNAKPPQWAFLTLFILLVACDFCPTATSKAELKQKDLSSSIKMVSDVELKVTDSGDIHLPGYQVSIVTD
jgi:hypothetical protein